MIYKFKLVSVWMQTMRIMVLAMLSLPIIGCQAPEWKMPINTSQVHTIRDPQRTVDRDYLLSPGDQIHVIYQFPDIREDQYHLAIGDQLRVEFLEYPQFDRTVDIRPDGRITIPYEGDIDAAGLTPAQLASAINQRYSNLMRRPQSSVSLIRYGQQVRELKDAINTSDRGMSRLIRVNLDGRISLPLIDEPIPAAGLTMEELHQQITTGYQRICPYMVVSSTLMEATGNLIHVSGAVGKPGVYELTRPTNSLQAIATAGGLTSHGKSSSVLWISRDEMRHPVGRILDLDTLMEKGDPGHEVLMRQGDVLYVPSQPLTRADLNADYLWRMIPVNLRLFYKPPSRTSS